MRTRVIGLLIFTLCVLGTLAAVAVAAGRGSGPAGAPGLPLAGADAVALIKLDGTITDATVAPYRSGRDRDNVYAQLQKAEHDDSIKAVVLRINSPGGSAAASQAIYDQIRRIQARGKKVVAHLTDVAASGGYYVAAASDRIVSQPAALTGSIGVIITSMDLRGLYEKIGVQDRVIKSGPYKDILSPTRDMTPDEQAILEKLVQDTLDQFIKVVAEGRNLDEAEVRRIADGRVFSGKEALNLRLVDELGDQHRAIQLAGELSGLGKEPRVVLFEQPRSRVGLLDLLGSATSQLELDRLIPEPGIGVRYEWRG
ncbi:MAG: signal peptide peptidase SppA [Sphingomonadaceae bacterium]